MPTVHFAPPAFSLDDAARIARDEFGIAGVISALPGERDLNFRVDAPVASYVLKIANVEEKRGDLELQHAALEHLARREPELVLQRARPAPDGTTIVAVTSATGERHLARLLTFLPGVLWADVHPHSPALLESLGRVLGRVDRALADFEPAAALRALKWDLRQAGWIRDFVGYVEGRERRALVEHWLAEFDRQVLPTLDRLRQGVIYNDANDHNIVVAGPASDRFVAGVIDFGDLCRTNVVCEPAIAAAYAAMGLGAPIAGIARLLAGYHEIWPLEEAELEIFHALVCLRLAVSVANSAYQKTVEPANRYLTISEVRAWKLLEQLSATAPELAHYCYRAACGYPAHPRSPRLVAWLRRHRAEIGRVVEPDLTTAQLIYCDWSVDSAELGTPDEMADAAAMTARLWRRMAAAGAIAAIGGYAEPRPIYGGESFRLHGNDRDEWRTVHLGVDIFLPAGAAVYAPLDGVVHSFANNAARFDYGPCIVLEHSIADDQGPIRFHTLYGHLSAESLAHLAVGQRVRRGDRLATLGDFPINGNWPPHLHLQIVLDMLGRSGDFDGSCAPSQRPVWLSLCPDPNLLAQVPEALLPPPPPSHEELLALRRALLPANLSLSYREPLEIVRGFRQWLYDADGQRYLDAFNNVPHVGHGHPRVVRAACEQLALLNTNTRYLQAGVLRYAERLLAKFSAPLRVCYFTASGSEANELALRLARAHTGARDLVVMAGAYHGHTTSLIEISPYKHDGPGGEGAPDWVHVSPVPDVYRGEFRAGAADAGARYAQRVGEVVAGVRADGRRLAGYIAETLPSVGGQIVPPDGFYAAVYAAVRAAGGVVIADEVQTGFGRTGATFWAFERYGVTPDIVVLGKPIANGYPLGAVITTAEIAASFANGMEFFSTFGGCTAACAAALATLEVVEEEQLQRHAAEVGGRLLRGLEELASRHPLVGDVRGAGLFLGVELVRDRETLEPAGAEASHVAERMRDRGILLGTDGPHQNVLKIRPPLCFETGDADFLVATLDLVLAEDAVRVRRGR